MLMSANSVDEILRMLPQLKKDDIDDNIISCKSCKDNLRENFAKGVFTVKSRSFQRLPPQGDSADNQKIKDLNRQFSNLKKNIARHLLNRCLGDISPEEDNLNSQADVSAGLAIARTWLYIIVNGRPYIDSEQLTQLQHINGVKLGNINHSREFIDNFLDAMYVELKNQIFNYLEKCNKKTGEPLPCAITADLATYQHVITSDNINCTHTRLG